MSIQRVKITIRFLKFKLINWIRNTNSLLTYVRERKRNFAKCSAFFSSYSFRFNAVFSDILCERFLQIFLTLSHFLSLWMGLCECVGGWDVSHSLQFISNQFNWNGFSWLGLDKWSGCVIWIVFFFLSLLNLIRRRKIMMNIS